MDDSRSTIHDHGLSVCCRSGRLDHFRPLRILVREVFCESVARLRSDVLIVASYGKILPSPLLAVPILGALNVHPSLLPAYRGATPIQAALRDGLSSTGVSIIWMNERMDAGDIALVEGMHGDVVADQLGDDIGLQIRKSQHQIRLPPQDHANLPHISRDDRFFQGIEIGRVVESFVHRPLEH